MVSRTFATRRVGAQRPEDLVKRTSSKVERFTSLSRGKQLGLTAESHRRPSTVPVRVLPERREPHQHTWEEFGIRGVPLELTTEFLGDHSCSWGRLVSSP